jgi:hypothetical protein
VVKAFVFFGVAMLAAGSASAQAQRAAVTDPVKVRQKISTMEGVLERAVANGADNMFRGVRRVMPMADGLRLIGAPQVSGFRLEGYGVFFDVEVPQLLMPPAWELRYMVDQNGLAAGTALADLRSILSAVPAQQRARAEQAIARLEMQVGPSEPIGSPRLGAAGPSLAAAQAVSQAVAPPAAPVDPVVVEDPNVTFTREVKSALIEAMLENSGAMALGNDEWLVVAARDSSRPDRLAVTGGADDLHTIMFRVKGSDLAAFHSGTITLDDARKRVEVREY